MAILEAKAAVVTGAGRGIGLATAKALVQAGAKVAIAEIDPDLASQASDALGENALAIETDIANETQVRAMIGQAIDTFGHLDILVNNAATSARGGCQDLDVEDWRRVIDVDLTGAFLCAKFASGALRDSRGSLVNIASTRALMSEPETLAYSAAKGGLVALTHSLAASLAPDVRVNCISPGWIDTRAYRPGGAETAPLRPIDHQQHWAGRVGRPEDIASMVLYLCSEGAGFITGQNFVVDGGMTRKMIYQE